MDTLQRQTCAVALILLVGVAAALILVQLDRRRRFAEMEGFALQMSGTPGAPQVPPPPPAPGAATAARPSSSNALTAWVKTLLLRTRL